MTENEKRELDWLRFFREAVVDALGPADDEIIQDIRDEWTAKGKNVADVGNVTRAADRKKALQEAVLKRRPWLRWYRDPKWCGPNGRRAVQLRDFPFCAFHLKQGEEVPADTADHVHAHRGNFFSFWNGALQSLCAHCHNSVKQSMERGQKSACGDDGFPIDPGHPWNIEN